MFLNILLNRFKTKSYTSKVNEPIRVGRSFGRKAIFAGSIPQSGGEFIYEWDTVIGKIHKKSYFPKNCLILGVAGGSAINSLKKFYPKIQITGVEIDPVILKVALAHGLFKKDKNTELIIADATDWIAKSTKKYDVIVVDLYLGDKNISRARDHLFLKRVKNHLAPDGIALYSCHYSVYGMGEYKEFTKVLRSLFKKIEVLFEFPKNKVLLLEN